MPTEVILLRHAEKPDDEQSPELAHKGRVRAAALSEYLPHRFGAPTFLFATKPSPVSNRPVLTLNPLSEALGLPIDTSFQDEEYKLLAQEIVSQSRFGDARVIICWHHGKIPELARALTVHDPPDLDWFATRRTALWKRLEQSVYFESSTPFGPPTTARPWTNDEVYRHVVGDQTLDASGGGTIAGLQVLGIGDFVQQRRAKVVDPLKQEQLGKSGVHFSTSQWSL